jgi:hypothetical protein
MLPATSRENHTTSRASSIKAKFVPWLRLGKPAASLATVAESREEFEAANYRLHSGGGQDERFCTLSDGFLLAFKRIMVNPF